MPSKRGLPPSVSQGEIDPEEWARRRNALVPVVVPAPAFGAEAPQADGQVTLHQDAALYAGVLDEGAEVSHHFGSSFGGYAFVVQAPSSCGATRD